MSATHSIYTSKAEKYARYRWSYAPEALDAIFRVSGLGPSTVAADLGAGTGILSLPLCARCARVFALEPNLEMAALAAFALRDRAGACVLASTAEDTALASGSLDLVTAGQAIHWFDPKRALPELRRILKPSGWLAVLYNHPQNSPEFSQALSDLNRPEYGVRDTASLQPGAGAPPSTYFAAGWQEFSFSFASAQTWEQFLGSLLSASYMPLENDLLYPALERAARAVFDRFSHSSLLPGLGVTRLWIGKVK